MNLSDVDKVKQLKEKAVKLEAQIYCLTDSEKLPISITASGYRQDLSGHMQLAKLIKCQLLHFHRTDLMKVRADLRDLGVNPDA